MRNGDSDLIRLKERFSALLGREVTSAARMAGGRNTRVYRLECAASTEIFVGKHYFHHEADCRDRLNTEFLALSFLRENRIRCVPAPIGSDQEHGLAVYQFIKGRKIHSERVTADHIEAAADFLTRLKEIRFNPGSRGLPRASEACFSLEAITESLDFRLKRLDAVREGSDEICRQLDTYLSNEFCMRYAEIQQWCCERAEECQLGWDREIDIDHLTLSPSDFGFHNALQSDAGEMVFLDFEYFGWDDPAKTISDFLLHPAMDLSYDLKSRFFARLTRAWADYPELTSRVEVVYPLFGLKWCLIFLNEFVNEHLARRDFAGTNGTDSRQLRSVQLAKSRTMLQRITSEYKSFPYHA